MPGNMTMKRPHPGIHGIVLHNKMPIRLHQLHVAPLRVPAVNDAAVPGAKTFVQHVHVVPVQMHGVRYRGGVFDNQPHRGCIPRVVDVPFGIVGVRCVALVCK